MVQQHRGLLPPSRQLSGRPVPGGKSQSGRTSAAYFANQGDKSGIMNRRGLVGSGTADYIGRMPAQQKRGGAGKYIGGSAKVPTKFF